MRPTFPIAGDNSRSPPRGLGTDRGRRGPVRVAGDDRGRRRRHGAHVPRARWAPTALAAVRFSEPRARPGRSTGAQRSPSFLRLQHGLADDSQRKLQVSLALATCRWPLAVGDGGLERKQPAPMKREWPAHMGGPFACKFFMVDHSSVMRRPEIIVRIASHVIRRRFEPVLCRTLRARLS